MGILTPSEETYIDYKVRISGNVEEEAPNTKRTIVIYNQPIEIATEHGGRPNHGDGWSYMNPDDAVFLIVADVYSHMKYENVKKLTDLGKQEGIIKRHIFVHNKNSGRNLDIVYHIGRKNGVILISTFYCLIVK